MPEKDNENKEEVIQVLVSPSERLEIIEAAAQDQRPVSSWCRIIILDKLNELREHK